MRKVKEKRIASCPKCHKQTAWVYIHGERPFWLCLLCATREEAPMQEPPDPREIRAKVNTALDAVGETLARAHTALDRTRKLLHKLGEVHQGRRASAERKAEQQARPYSDSPPSSTPPTPASPPEPVPAAEPPAKNASG